ncbi:MAG: uroporphyrinogen-III C-methyltransferase [Suilimivivens sp.]
MMKNNTGMVYLIGAGPGAEELITIRGAALLKEAEVLLYDRLASPEFLLQVPEICEKIYVGKREGNHSVSQEKINELLVEKAKEGKTVVRLKGGDPFVFGRGGEEILALEKENIPYEVVPGITSAIGALEMAGIPVTHREEARSFHVITGHTAKEQEPERFCQYGKLEGTLIFLMGVGNLPLIREQLLKAGKDKDTPAAIVEQGTCIRQRRIDGTLETIVEEAEENQVKPPAILVVGKVAACHMVSETRPLSGRKIAVTGTAAMTEKLEKKLKDLGAFVYSASYLKVVPTDILRKEMPDWSAFSWLVFTSGNGVKQFFEQIRELQIDVRELSHFQYAVIGRGTADMLWQYGIHADYIPKQYTVEELAKGLSQRLCREEKVLVLRAKEGSKDLPKIFREQEVSFEDLGIYETIADKDMAEQLWQQRDILDTVTFASSSGVKAFFAAKPMSENVSEEKGFPKRLICIGRKTEEALRENLPPEEWKRIRTAKEYTAEGLIETLLAEQDNGNDAFSRSKTEAEERI